MSRMSRNVVLSLLLCGVLANACSAETGPVKVELLRTGDKWQLLRAGKPYFIKGGGGGGSKQVLADCGGNSLRTWGVGPDTERLLDEAQQLGLTVTMGIWLGHKEQGFRYDDAAAVQKQFADAKQAVLRYKDHPALLMWALGNEMEVQDDSAALWQAIQDLAVMVHQTDPAHPTMTVIAELGTEKVPHLHKYCADIDVVGINSYGGGPSLAERYRKAGGTKPFVVTEFGPPGTWEITLNAFKAAPELTSTEKARFYRETYQKAVLGAPDLCVGSYAFTWGHKIEATATWFGMFLPDNSRLAAVDTMQELWSGKAPLHACPVMKKLTLSGADQVERSDTITATVELGDSKSKIEWALYPEQASYAVEGLGGPATPALSDAIAKNGETRVQVKLPAAGGVYRLYCTLHNEHGGAAVGSLPIKVRGPAGLVKAVAPKLPLVVFGEGQPAPFIPSGWMGNTKAIAMDEEWTDNPHSGKTCLKVSFNDNGGWGSVVWQHPANDWGTLPGGYDLSQAESLVFWARGKKGGEKVKFGFGLLGIEKKYHDSAKVETEVTLTTEWKQYTIDLSEKELTRIKSGFLWNLVGQGEALEFYLDDIEYR